MCRCNLWKIYDTVSRPWGIFLVVLYFIIKEEITFLLTYSAPLILVRIILKGNFSYEIESFGNVPLGENQCNIIFLPTGINKLHFQPGEHILFEALCNPPSMLQALLRFPMFEDFKTNIKLQKPALLCMQSIKPSASVIECIYKIIHSPFSENVRQFHINSIKDLLIHILKASSRSKPVNTRFTVDELERIYAAQAFIDKHLPTHYSISLIARHVGMNEKKAEIWIQRGYRDWTIWLFFKSYIGNSQNRG